MKTRATWLVAFVLVLGAPAFAQVTDEAAVPRSSLAEFKKAFDAGQVVIVGRGVSSDGRALAVPSTGRTIRSRAYDGPRASRLESTGALRRPTQGDYPVKNINDVLAAIQALSTSPDAGERAHGASLTGPRTAGSTTHGGLDVLPGDLPLETFTPEAGAIPCCTYLRATGPDVQRLGGILGAAPYSAVQAAGLAHKIRLGRHGPEMYLDVAPGSRQHGEILDAVGASAPLTLTVVMGPRETPGATGLIPWTWFPGEPLATTSDRVKRGPDGQLAFAFGRTDGQKVETLTDEIRDLVQRTADATPALGVKLHNG